MYKTTYLFFPTDYFVDMLNRKHRFKSLSQIVLRKMYFIIKTRITDIHKSCVVQNYAACSFCIFIQLKPKMNTVITL